MSLLPWGTNVSLWLSVWYMSNSVLVTTNMLSTNTRSFVRMFWISALILDHTSNPTHTFSSLKPICTYLKMSTSSKNIVSKRPPRPRPLVVPPRDTSKCFQLITPLFYEQLLIILLGYGGWEAHTWYSNTSKSELKKTRSPRLVLSHIKIGGGKKIGDRGYGLHQRSTRRKPRKPRSAARCLLPGELKIQLPASNSSPQVRFLSSLFLFMIS